jgi:hypothetical protein
LQGTFLRAHVEGGSGRSEASPTAVLQDTHSVEGEFCEVELPLNGVLRSWLLETLHSTSRRDANLAFTLFAMRELRSTVLRRYPLAVDHGLHTPGVQQQDHHDAVGDERVGEPWTRGAVEEQAGQHD